MTNIIFNEKTSQNEIHLAIYNWLFNGNNGISELSVIAAAYNEDGTIKSDSRVVYTPETIGSSDIIQEYIDGTKELRYNFILRQFSPLSTESNTTRNLKVLNVFEDLLEWMKVQAEQGDLPKFPDTVNVSQIKINPATIAGTDATGMQVQVIIQIDYTEN